MKLLIDIGNTSAKLAVTEGDDIIHFERLAESWSGAFARLCATWPIDSVRLCSVAGPDTELDKALDNLSSTFPSPLITRLTASTPCPIKHITDVPPTYGADRWAADIGAIVQDLTHTLLIIDAGTCITYDLFSSDGRLLGGAISPGVQLRLNAMHEHTALLPLFQAEAEAPLLGTDTRGSMLSAAINGARFEVEGYIRHIWNLYPDLHVFITGGNSFRFSPDIVCPITHDPHLVLRGLNAI